LEWMKLLRWLYSIYAFLLFVAIMLLIFPVCLLAGLLGRIRGGNVIIRLCMLWADLWFPLIFIQVRRIYEGRPDKKRPYIFLANHIAYIDAALLMKAVRQPFRPLAKAEMKRIPLFGFIYDRATVLVKRDNPADRAHSLRLLRSITRRGISVLVFPEGTFNVTGEPLKEFYNGAFRVAIETGTPILPMLFLDTHERMPHSSPFHMSPGRCRIVYLPPIPVEGLALHQLRELKSSTFDLMERKLIEYGATWIRKPSREFQ